MNRKASYPELVRERERLLKVLAAYPPVLRGSLRRHGNKCGNPTCACHDKDNPKRHGPYYYLSHRYQDKTRTIFLTPLKLPYAKAWLANYKKLIQLIYRLSADLMIWRNAAGMKIIIRKISSYRRPGSPAFGIIFTTAVIAKRLFMDEGRAKCRAVISALL